VEREKMSEPVSDPLALPENYATKLKQVRSLIGPLHGVGYNEGVQAGYAAGWLECAARARELLSGKEADRLRKCL
jgi:hypothetical protein